MNMVEITRTCNVDKLAADPLKNTSSLFNDISKTSFDTCPMGAAMDYIDSVAKA